MATSKTGETAKKYLERFTDTPTLSLARKMYAENKLLFTNLEHARTTLRRLRGSSGKLNLSEMSDKRFVGTTPKAIPISLSEPNEEYHLPLANNNILLISDLHIPYHDVKAIEAAVKYGKEQKVNTVFINGDMLDFHLLSRFQKDPHSRSVKEEFDTARAMLEYLRYEFPKAKIIWLKGNHDKRYEHWLFNKAPEIFNDSYYQLESRLRLNELKIELLDDLIMCKAGKLFITHGHLMIRGVFAPVNAARGLYLRAKQSCVIGHTHSVSEHTEKNLSGELTSTWSTGCLCELRPAYDPFVNKHAHGFAHVRFNKNGDFTVRNYRINKGKIL